MMVPTGQKATERPRHIKKRLDDNQLDNQHEPPLRTHHPIPASIITDNLIIISELNLPRNLPSLLSFDINAPEEASGELATDYLQMIRNND